MKNLAGFFCCDIWDRLMEKVQSETSDKEAGISPDYQENNDQY